MPKEKQPPQEIDRILGQVIKEQMGELTHLALSTSSGIPRSTLTKLLNGNVPFLVSHLESIGDALKIPGYRLLDMAEKILTGNNVVEFPSADDDDDEDTIRRELEDAAAFGGDPKRSGVDHSHPGFNET